MIFNCFEDKIHTIIQKMVYYILKLFFGMLEAKIMSHTIHEIYILHFDQCEWPRPQISDSTQKDCVLLIVTIVL